MKRTTGRARARLLWGLVAATIVLLSFPYARAEGETVEKTDRFDLSYPTLVDADVTPPNADLMFWPAGRRAFQLMFSLDGRTILRAFDLDSKGLIKERLMPFESFPQGPSASPSRSQAAEWVHAIDQTTGTLYVAYTDFTGTFGGVTVIDGTSLNSRSFTRPIVTGIPEPPDPTTIDPTNPDPGNIGCTSSSCLPQPPVAAPIVNGMAFVPSELSADGRSKLLFIFSESVNSPATTRNFNLTYLAQWDAETGQQDFLYRVAACGGAAYPVTGLYQAAIFQARRSAGYFLVCGTSGGAAQVVRITLDLNARPDREIASPGPLGFADALADPDTDRVMIRVANIDGESWWVFDGFTNSYVGVIGISVSGGPTSVSAADVDPLTGRLYTVTAPSSNGRVSTPGGFLMSDTRRNPAPQALAFEQFAGKSVGRAHVDTNPDTGLRRVFVRPVDADHYVIFRDGVPISEDPPVEDQDRLTLPVSQEDPREHGRNYGGSGHAFGIRALFVGGLQGTPATGPDLNGIRVGRHVPQWTNSPCGPGDRELIVGIIKNAALSNNILSASSAVGEADPITKTDIGEPSARCYPRPTDPSKQDIWGTGQTAVYENGRLVRPDLYVPVREEYKRRELWKTTLDAFEAVNPAAADRLRIIAPDLSDIPGEYPQPHRLELDKKRTGEDDQKTDIDELAGTDWSLSSVECAGDEKRSTHAELTPLARGDQTTSPLRKLRDSPTIENERFRAQVDCAEKLARVRAVSELVMQERNMPQMSAAFEIKDVPGIGTIRIGEVSAETFLYLDPKRGLVAVSISKVRNISIGDEIFIDGAYTLGEAFAHGVYGSAGTTFERRICGVVVKEQLKDRKVYRPLVQPGISPNLDDPPKTITERDDPTIDPQDERSEIKKQLDQQVCGDPNNATLGTQPVVDAINRVLGARGRASAPSPDYDLARGTPGGYLASIQKDRFEAISARAVNNDASTQVPAFELIIFNDDPQEGRGRQVYQFAGVDASVTYGLFLLNPDEFFLPDGDDTLQDELVDLTGGTPYTEPPAQPGNPRRGPLTMLFQGTSFLLRSPKDALLAAAVWLVLFAPVQLATRRRALKAVAAT